MIMDSTSELTHKRVKLHCVGDKVFDGFVYIVDPVSGNFILYTKKEESFYPIIVCRSSIEKIEVSVINNSKVK